MQQCQNLVHDLAGRIPFIWLWLQRSLSHGKHQVLCTFQAESVPTVSLDRNSWISAFKDTGTAAVRTSLSGWPLIGAASWLFAVAE